jgi:hypothetical protein
MERFGGLRGSWWLPEPAGLLPALLWPQPDQEERQKGKHGQPDGDHEAEAAGMLRGFEWPSGTGAGGGGCC